MISLVHTLLPASHATPGRWFTRNTTSTDCVPTPSATTSTRPVYQPADRFVVKYAKFTVFVLYYAFPFVGLTLSHVLVVVTVYVIVSPDPPVFAIWNTSPTATCPAVTSFEKFVGATHSAAP